LRWGFGLLTYHDALTLPLLFVLAALHGVARVFVGPSMAAIAPNIVPPESLPRAIALGSIAWQVHRSLARRSGGLMYAQNAAGSYWMTVALLILSSISIASVRPVFPPPMTEKKHPVRMMVEGMKYTFSERFLLGAITLDLFAVLLAGATALLPVYARDILHVGPDGLGQLRAAPAFGAAIVAIYLSFRPLKHNVGAKMLWAVVVFGIATIGFGYSHLIGQYLFGNAEDRLAEHGRIYGRRAVDARAYWVRQTCCRSMCAALWFSLIPLMQCAAA
jgi:hypothetical protein